MDHESFTAPLSLEESVHKSALLGLELLNRLNNLENELETAKQVIWSRELELQSAENRIAELADELRTARFENDGMCFDETTRDNSAMSLDNTALKILETKLLEIENENLFLKDQITELRYESANAFSKCQQGTLMESACQTEKENNCNNANVFSTTIQSNIPKTPLSYSRHHLLVETVSYTNHVLSERNSSSIIKMMKPSILTSGTKNSTDSCDQMETIRRKDNIIRRLEVYYSISYLKYTFILICWSSYYLKYSFMSLFYVAFIIGGAFTLSTEPTVQISTRCSILRHL